MTIDRLIEQAESEIAVKKVTLREWIIAKCQIEDQITLTKAMIESWERHLKILLDERRASR